MLVLIELLLPPILAMLLCCHLGYAFARLALPDGLRPYRAPLTPLLGCAIFLILAAALTTTTALTPPWIAAGLAIAALPINIWACLRRPASRERRWTADGGRRAEDRRPKAKRPTVEGVRCQSSMVGLPAFGVELGALAISWLLGGLVFTFAILPPMAWRAALPIGSNWDAAEFYVPLGRALQLASQRDIAAIGRSPLTNIFTTAPVAGRIHAFSYLHAAVSSAAGIEPLRSYAGVMAFVLALVPLAVYPLGRVVGLPRAASLLGTALSALGWLPLWVAYNNFSNHLMSLPLLPAALAGSIVALRSGGRRALATGGLLVAGLATAYYPAMTAYVALFGPVALYLVLRQPTAGGRRTTTDENSLLGRPKTKDQRPKTTDGASCSALGPRSSVLRRWSIVGRGVVLAALSFILSGATQAYFFLRSGFLDEILKRATGFQVNEYVGAAEALGLAAMFNRESSTGDARLVVVATAVAIGLGLLAIVARRAPLLTALVLGAALYQGYTAAGAYHYGFYKGITFELPIFALSVAAGATAVWERTSLLRQGGEETRKQDRFLSPNMLVSLSTRLALCAGLALLLGLNGWTTWKIQQTYAEAGPQLWTATESDAAELRAYVPAGTTVLLAAPSGRSAVFNSLLSYALLGHDLLGTFQTGYDRLDAPPRDRPADLALLPETADPASYGYRSDDVRWAGAGMRLYGRAPGVRYHRALGEGGRYPSLAPGASLTLRLGSGGIALPSEPAPEAGPPIRARLGLAIASFKPTTIELNVDDRAQRYELPGGLAEIAGDALQLPGEIRVRNSGAEPAYLWWGEIADPSTLVGVTPRDDAFIQIESAGSSGAELAADIQVHTAVLPGGPQKLTAVVAIAHTPGNTSDWQELGQWIFFPSGGKRLRFTTDPDRLIATLSSGGAPLDLVGATRPAGDGKYRATLLLANDARVVYGTTLWTWNIRDGKAQNIFADPVPFDVVPLPRPASPLDARSADDTMRLRGYTMPQQTARSSARVELSLVWQSLRKIEGDLHARVTLRGASGRVLAERVQPIGAPDHGTHTWQEGEIAEQPFELVVPDDTLAERATIVVELIGTDGLAVAFADGAKAIELTELAIAP
jgi:hypothetical protein